MIQENLSAMLGRADIHTFPQTSRSTDAIQVMIDMTRFDIDPKGDAILVAFWSISDKNDPSHPMKRKTVIRQTPGSPEHRDKVIAQSRTLAAFSREIAEALRMKGSP